MKFICDANLFSNDYSKKLEEYNDRMEEYNRTMDKYADDEALSKAYISEKPVAPEPDTGKVEFTVRNNDIRAFEVITEEFRKEEKDQIIKVFLDGTKHYYEYIITKYDDKIIEQLDELLGNK